MKICPETLTLLKHFSTINSGISIDPGNRIFSKSELGTMIAVATVSETFDKQFVTSYLANFLAAASLYDNPEFSFESTHVCIESDDGSQKTKFFYGNPDLVNQKNKLPKPQPEVAFSFTLNREAYAKVLKAAATLSAPDICFKASGGKIMISAFDRKISTSSSFELHVADCDPELDYSFCFKKQYLNLMNSFTYECSISTTCLAEFTAVDSPFSELRFFTVAEQV